MSCLAGQLERGVRVAATLVVGARDVDEHQLLYGHKGLSDAGNPIM